jgi:hypothetical protein
MIGQVPHHHSFGQVRAFFRNASQLVMFPKIQAINQLEREQASSLDF